MERFPNDLEKTYGGVLRMCTSTINLVLAISAAHEAVTDCVLPHDANVTAALNAAVIRVTKGLANQSRERMAEFLATKFSFVYIEGNELNSFLIARRHCSLLT